MDEALNKTDPLFHCERGVPKKGCFESSVDHAGCRGTPVDILKVATSKRDKVSQMEAADDEAQVHDATVVKCDDSRGYVLCDCFAANLLAAGTSEKGECLRLPSPKFK